MHFTTFKQILNIFIYPWLVRDMKAMCLCEYLWMLVHICLIKKSHWQIVFNTLFCCWPSSACPFSLGLSSIAFGGWPLTLYCWSCNHTITLTMAITVAVSVSHFTFCFFFLSSEKKNHFDMHLCDFKVSIKLFPEYFNLIKCKTHFLFGMG